jgi:hypothetical protein
MKRIASERQIETAAIMLRALADPARLNTLIRAAQASMLNGRLFEACYKQVFAQSKEPLKALRPRMR